MKKTKYCIACDKKIRANYIALNNGVEIDLCGMHYKEYLEQEDILTLIKEDLYGDDDSNSKANYIEGY